MFALREIRKYKYNGDAYSEGTFPTSGKIIYLKTGEMRVKLSRLFALQDACVVYLVEYFQDVNLAAIHAGRGPIK
jgi:histone H3/H4